MTEPIRFSKYINGSWYWYPHFQLRESMVKFWRDTKEVTVMSEVAWLIERGSPATYLSVEHEQYVWTEDVDKAIRFCRREDAEMIGEIVLEDCDRICNHMWMTVDLEKEDGH